ncbi:MAG: hypothetical protein ACM3ZQ_02660 [Bacillota bacterium]
MRLPKSIVAVVVCLLVLALSSPAVFAKPVDIKGGKITIDTDEIAKWLEKGDWDDDDDNDDDQEWSRGAFANGPYGLLSRFFGILKFKVAYGTFEQVNSSKGQPTITIKNTDGKLETYTTGNGVNVWQDGKKTKLSDLDKGDHVTLLLNPGGHVVAIMTTDDGQVTPPPATGNWQNGEVTQILREGSLRALTVQLNSGSSTFILAANASISFRNWSAGTFADIRVGDRITFRLADGKISELVVETATTSDAGRITAISSSAVSITRDNNTSASYPLGQNMTLTIEGVTQPSISKVLVGDRAQLQVRDGIVRAMHVIPATNLSGTVEATLTSGGNRYITIKKPDNTIDTYLLTTTATVSFTNWPAGTFADIRQGDTVRARLVNNKITTLIVETVTSSDAGQITAVSSSVVSIHRDNGTDQAYPFASNMTLSIQGVTNPTVSDVLVGDRAELLLRDGSVRSMHVIPATNLSGIVQTVGTTDGYRYVTVKKANNEIVYHRLTTSASVSFTHWPAGTFADIREGDTVRARLVNNMITNLIVDTVTNSANGVITAKTMSYVTIRQNDGNDHSYAFGQNMTLTIQGVTQPQLSDVKVGDAANLLLRDGIVRSMHVVPANLISGTIQSIIKTDDYRGVIIKKSDNQLTPYELAANAKVSFKNLMAATFDDIRIGDLVSIRLAEGKIIDLVIESVATSDRGTITAISTTSVIVKRENNTTQSYPLNQNMTLTITGISQPKLSDVFVGDKVELGLRDNVVFAMQVTPALSVTGTIEAIVNNSTTKALTIKNSDGNSVTHTLATNAVIVVKDQPNGTFSSLLAGDKVSARIVDNKIVRLEAEYTYTTVEGTVTLTSMSSTPKKIYLLATNGSASQAYTLANPCDVTIPGDTTPTLSEIKIGDRASLRLRGDLVRSITVNPHLSIFNAIFIRVTGSTTTPGIEVIREGNVVNYTLASSYAVVVPGKSSPTLADVAVGKTIKISMENNLIKKLEVIQ